MGRMNADSTVPCCGLRAAVCWAVEVIAAVPREAAPDLFEVDVNAVHSNDADQAVVRDRPAQMDCGHVSIRQIGQALLGFPRERLSFFGSIDTLKANPNRSAVVQNIQRIPVDDSDYGAADALCECQCWQQRKSG